MSRSGLIQEATRRLLEERRLEQEALARKKKMERAASKMDRLAEKFGKLDGVKKPSSNSGPSSRRKMKISAYHAGYVIDASVGMKWFIKDSGGDRDAALAIRQRHISGQTQMIVPELFLLEVPNAIKAARRGTEEELAEVLDVFCRLGDTGRTA